MSRPHLERVYVDANELFPFTVMDVLLALAEDLVIEFVWTDELLDEWQRVVVRDGGRSTESAAAIACAVRVFFADGRIDPVTYRPLTESTPGRDVDDRVHTAAAIAAGATVLVTRNRKDFPVEHLAAYGVDVLTADDYLTRLLRRRPVAVTETVRRLAGEKRRPPRTPCDLVTALARAGTPRFADRLGRRLGCTPTP